MEKPNYSYPNARKLKRQLWIDALFSSGQSVSAYPLRLVFVPAPEMQVSWQLGVSASKRHFKHATDRNRVKRLLREVFRLNQQLVEGQLPQPYALMLLYQSKDKPDFDSLQLLFPRLVEKMLRKINERTPPTINGDLREG